jgi:agmatine deiminase
MPVQIHKNHFVQFTYNPDYHQKPNDLPYLTDVNQIPEVQNLNPLKSELVVDGGNIIRNSDTVIMCDKVFHENRSLSEKEVIKQLHDFLEVDRLFFVPWNHRNDTIGHADGMVRFIDDSTVLINDLSVEDKEYQRSFRMALHNASLDWVELPYNPVKKNNSLSAAGIYINYLQMQQGIIMPTFNNFDIDQSALKVMKEVFKGQTISTIDCSQLAKGGGVLNCISWNISA